MWVVGLYDQHQLPQSGHIAFSKALEAWLLQAIPTTRFVNHWKVKMMTLLFTAGHIVKQDNGD